MSASSGLDADLNEIAVFTKVVEAQSFVGAARELGLPRSTVSRRVAKLEQRLGLRLLHRTTRRLSLTDVGATYYERCAESLAQIAEAEALMKAAQATPRGTLRLTAPHDLSGHLAPIIAAFIARYPDVRIEAELSQRMVDLVAEGFDIALRASATLPDSTLIARNVAHGEAQLFASPEYLAQHGTPHTPAELSAHHCIVLGPLRRNSSWRLEDDREATEVAIAARLHANDPTFARDAAIAGAGIAYLPAFLGAAAVSAGTLRRVLPEHHCPSARLYVVYPSTKHLSATVRAFRDHLIASFEPFPFMP